MTSGFCLLPGKVSPPDYTPFSTERIVRCFAGSSFTGADIIAGKKPVTVYLCFPEKDLLSKAPVIRLVLESILSEMIDTFDTTKGRNCRPTLAILDEAGNIGLPSLPQYVSTVRSRGISIWLAFQDNSQIESLYGRFKARTIRNNMLSKVFYWQSDTETAKDIAISLGYRSEFSRSHTLRHGEESSQSLSEQAVPLLTARDINELDQDEIIAFFSNRKPIRAKRMDWRAFSDPQKETRHFSTDYSNPFQNWTIISSISSNKNQKTHTMSI